MNWIDAGIVIVLLFFIVTAFQNGFVREAISMVSAIAGVVLAGLFYDDVAEALLSSIDNEMSKNVIAFLIIFVGCAVIGQLIAIVVHPAIVIMQLGIADQMLGAAFGAVKGFVIIEALLILMVTYPRYDMDQRINESQFGEMLLEVSEPLLKVLPAEFDSRVDAFKDGTIDAFQ